VAPPKLIPGQPITFPAAEWNRHVDASDAYHRTKALGEGKDSSASAADTNIVNAKNTSGSDRRQGEILEFSGTPLSSFQDGLIWLNGDSPALANGFGVLLQAAPDGKFQDSQVSGVCRALVNVTDTAHKYAKPVSGNAILQSATRGPVRILHKPSGTGERDCAVRLEQDVSLPAEMVVFELTSTLALGGAATAVICELAAGTYSATGDAITVVDFYPGYGMWAGLAGYRGLARKRADDQYDVLFMERAALIVKFTTYGDRNPAATTFTGTVVIAYQQGDRLPPGMDGNGRITIQDVEKLFPRALDGGTGLAIWNDVVGIYQCLTVQQQCVLARAQINDTGGMGAAGYVPISNFEACSFSPFSQVPSPAPTQAINFFLHRGRYQDDVFIAWDEASTDWIVIDVQKKALDVITDIRLKSDKTQIQVKQIRCAVEYQTDPNDPLRWVDKIPLKKCPTGSPTQ
jgi:hypothetical protein